MEWIEKCKQARELKLRLYRMEISYSAYLVEMKGLLAK
jgi:hypothetical protein